MTAKQRSTAILNKDTIACAAKWGGPRPTKRDILQPWGRSPRPADQRGRLTEAMRQSCHVGSSLGRRGGGPGGRGWAGRKAAEVTKSAGKRTKILSKIAWECQEQGKKPPGGLLEVPSGLACPGNRTACSSWLALQVSLEVGKAAPASRPAPVSPLFMYVALLAHMHDRETTSHTLFLPAQLWLRPGTPPAPLFLIPARSPSSAPSSPSSIPSVSVRSPARSSPVSAHGDPRRPAAARPPPRQQTCRPTFADYLPPPNIQPTCRVHVDDPSGSG